MRGRSGGVVLLLLAATTMFVTARLSNPALTDGRASIEPPPPPPSIQTCIARVGTSMATTADGQLVPQDLQYVSCDQPHQGEVFSVYEPMQIQDPSTPDAPSLCTEPGKDAWSYLGASPITDGEWIPLLQFGITLVPPSDRQQAAGQSWSACVLTYGWDDSIELSESIRGILAPGERRQVPAPLSNCVDSTEISSQVTVSCGAVHSAQVLATLYPPAPGATVEKLSRTCRELAVWATGRASITDEPGLSVVMTVVEYDAGPPTVVSAIPDNMHWTAQCAVAATAADRPLVDTLSGKEQQPIPWAR